MRRIGNKFILFEDGYLIHIDKIVHAHVGDEGKLLITLIDGIKGDAPGTMDDLIKILRKYE